MKICCQEISKIAQSGHTYCCWAHSFLIQPRHDKLLSFDLKIEIVLALEFRYECRLGWKFKMKFQNIFCTHFKSVSDWVSITVQSVSLKEKFIIKLGQNEPTHESKASKESFC